MLEKEIRLYNILSNFGYNSGLYFCEQDLEYLLNLTESIASHV